MSRTKRRVIVAVATMCVLLGSMTIGFAGHNIADLTKTKPWKFSESYFGGVKKAYIVKGNNSSKSAHAVYFINAVYDSASSAKTPSNYAQDTLYKVPIGKTCPKTPSSTFPVNKYFRILLNPYGENTTGCEAHGEQKDTQ